MLYVTIASILSGCVSDGIHLYSAENTEVRRVCNEIYSETITDYRGNNTNINKIIEISQISDFLLLGEVHTSPRHHQIQNRILAAVARSKRHKSILFEMVEPGHNAALRAFQDGRITGGDLSAALQWTERGWPIWEEYASLFVTSRQHGLKLAHAGLDGELVKHVNAFGPLGLPRRMRQELNIKPDEKFVVDFDALKSEVKRTHSADDPSALRLAVSQYVKDAYMARGMTSVHGPAILIAGSGHVRHDIGVPGHLKSLRPNARIVSIGLIEEDGVLERKKYFTEDLAAKKFDFLWFTSTSCPLPPPQQKKL